MQRSSPLASTGLIRFEASMTPPEAAPAPITVWISSMNRIAPGSLLQLRQHALQALLEVAAVLGAGDQRAHVEREDRAVGEHVRDLVLDDQPRQALGDRGLADAGLADVQRVVLAPPAQDLDRALDLELAADQRVDAALGGEPVQVACSTCRARCRGRRPRRARRPRRPGPRPCRRPRPCVFDRPCEMKLTTSRRVTSCMPSR